jgi:hypothetical protein
MTRTSRVIALAGAAALAVSLGLPGVASASSGASTSAMARQANAVSADDTSTVFAGYTTDLGSKKSIVGTFVVPKLKCGAKDEGIDTLIELAADGGATYSDGAVYSSCVGGTGTHNAVFESSIDGQIAIPNTVENGDKIKVTQTFKKGKIALKMENLTKKWTAKQTFTGITPDSAAALQYTITVGGSVVAPLSTGGTFTGVTVGGQDLKKTKPTKTTLVDSGGKAILAPTKIKNGTNFSIKYKGK